MCFTGNTEILNSIERLVKFKEYVLRYNTIRLEKNFAIEEKAKSDLMEESVTENIEIEKKDNNDLVEHVENN